MLPQDMDPALSYCTHLIYGYAAIAHDTHKLVAMNPNLDLDQGHGNYRVVTQMKRKFPQLKVLLSVGGGADNEEPEKYNTLVGNIFVWFFYMVFLCTINIIIFFGCSTARISWSKNRFHQFRFCSFEKLWIRWIGSRLAIPRDQAKENPRNIQWVVDLVQMVLTLHRANCAQKTIVCFFIFSFFNRFHLARHQEDLQFQSGRREIWRAQRSIHKIGPRNQERTSSWQYVIDRYCNPERQ